MFRKTVVALGLTAFAAQGFAAKLESTPVVVSPQAIETSTNVEGGSFKITTEAAIASGSVLNVTYAVAPTNPAAINVAMSGAKCETKADGTDDFLTYAGTTNGGKTLNYSAVEKTGAAFAAGCIITTGATTAPAFPKGTVTATGISVSSAFTVVGSGVDPSQAALVKADGTESRILVSLGAAQFSQTVAGADAVIDVSDDRETFVGATTDTIVVTVKNTGKGATSPSNKTVISGDFSWADDAATAGFQIKGDAIALTKSETDGHVTLGTGVNKPTASAITIIDTSPANGDTYTLTLKPQVGALATALPVGKFTATTTVSYTDKAASTGSVALTTAAGALTLNGATVKVYSVPFGPEVESHSIFVSNAGKAVGAITGVLSYGSNDPVTFSLGDIAPNGNKYLNIKAALEAIDELPAFGRGDITFTVNAPAANITITAAYNTAEGRANLFVQEQANLAPITKAIKTKVDTL